MSRISPLWTAVVGCCVAFSYVFFWDRLLVVDLIGQRFWLGSVVSLFFVQFSKFFYRFSLQTSWLRCIMTLSNFQSVVDDEAGTRVGPKGRGVQKKKDPIKTGRSKKTDQ